MFANPLIDSIIEEKAKPKDSNLKSKRMPSNRSKFSQQTEQVKRISISRGRNLRMAHNANDNMDSQDNKIVEEQETSSLNDQQITMD